MGILISLLVPFDSKACEVGRKKETKKRGDHEFFKHFGFVTVLIKGHFCTGKAQDGWFLNRKFRFSWHFFSSRKRGDLNSFMANSLNLGPSISN